MALSSEIKQDLPTRYWQDRNHEIYISAGKYLMIIRGWLPIKAAEMIHKLHVGFTNHASAESNSLKLLEARIAREIGEEVKFVSNPADSDITTGMIKIWIHSDPYTDMVIGQFKVRLTNGDALVSNDHFHIQNENKDGLLTFSRVRRPAPRNIPPPQILDTLALAMAKANATDWDKFKYDIELYFPAMRDVERSQLKMTEISIYSTTWATEGVKIANFITELWRRGSIRITDATANVGGNTIAFHRAGMNVNSVEIEPVTCDILKHNLQIYHYPIDQVYCDDYLDIYRTLQQDVIFMDPEWGGPDYKNKVNLRLTLGGRDMAELAKEILTTLSLAKMVVLKLPVNYDFTDLDQQLSFAKASKLPVATAKGRIRYIVMAYYLS